MAFWNLQDKDDLRFMPDVEAAVRQRGHRFAYVLSLLAVLFFVVMGIWANYAVLDEVTRGDGTVIPSSKTQIIQNLEGGILAEILVREGAIVEKGDILVRIDNSAAEADFRDARSQYLILRARIARLEAELEGKEDIVFPADVLQGEPKTAADQQALFTARRNQLAAQVSVLKSQASQRRQEIVELRSRQQALERGLQLSREEMAITRPLVEKGIMPKLDLIQLERQIAELQGEIRTIDATMPRLETAAAEAGKRIDELLLTTRAQVWTELNEVRAEMNSVAETLFAGKDRVTRTEVRSPVRGTIKEIKHNTVGGVIQPGQDILEIVPLDDTLLIEAHIRPADIAFLRPGQKATIKITAYDFSIYGGLPARLEQISASTIKDEEGESFYRVYLRTETNTIEHQGQTLPIIPGMTATVEILTGQKTVLDYLLKPILKARDRALRER